MVFNNKKFRRLGKLYLCIFFFSFFFLTEAESTIKKKVHLKNSLWQISINPSTLKIEIQPLNEKRFILSQEQKNLGPISDLKESANKITFRIPDKKLTVSIMLSQRDLSVDFKSESVGRLTFPVITKPQALKALILPIHEGYYVPVDDPVWVNYLARYPWKMTEFLAMPFIGLQLDSYALTCLFKNQFDNELHFIKYAKTLSTAIKHEFRDQRSVGQYGLLIHLNENNSPVSSAKRYRQYLFDTNGFVSWDEKLKTIKHAEQLKGAIHPYLHGISGITFDDIHMHYSMDFRNTLIREAGSDKKSVGLRIKELLSDRELKKIIEIPSDRALYTYEREILAGMLMAVLKRKDFYQKEYFQGIAIPGEAKELIQSEHHQPLSRVGLFKKNSLLFRAAYKRYIRPFHKWGYGSSTRMLKQLESAGINRAKLVIVNDEWDLNDYLPHVAQTAIKMGYLVGPYDSYQSVHNPKDYGISGWGTAQFNDDVFKKGGIISKDGSVVPGFQKKGIWVNTKYIRPFMEERVSRIIKANPYNYYFMDCDGCGDFMHDYSAAHPMTEKEDAFERKNRIKWISNSFNTLIGTECNHSALAPVIHVAEGTSAPVFGKWRDKDMANKKSKYYLGAWYPPTGPQRFLEQVPLKKRLVHVTFDPRYRLPLNEIVFHDSFVSTHHWESGSLKFKNILNLVELTDLLYMNPPMYHFNPVEFEKNRAYIMKHYHFFSPIHARIGFSQMTDFQWLTPDRLVQKTQFGDEVELIANFRNEKVLLKGIEIPAGSIKVVWKKTGKTAIYTTPWQDFHISGT